MVWKGELLPSKKIHIQDDQEKVLHEYFKGCGRVVVSAGAGTGKTTLLVEIVSESVIKLINEFPEANPFEKILAVTFTVEAARQMKSKIKKRLQEHFKEKGEEEKIKDLLRWIDNDSWIVTLDSLTRLLLSEIIYDIGLGSVPSVPDEYEMSNLINDIISEIERDQDLYSDLQLLGKTFANQEWKGELGWRDLLLKSFEKSRMYCLSAAEFERNAFDSFLNSLYLGKESPFNKEDIKKIFSNLRAGSPEGIDPKNVDKSFTYNRKILISFIRVYKKYNEIYNEKTLEKGLLSHDDARYWIVKYANGEIDGVHYLQSWKNTQNKRFKHVVVDEFQDTSYVQCELIRNFIGDKTKVLLIGDPKQAIFQWRSADPEIFIDIFNSVIEHGVSVDVPYLNKNGFNAIELTSNFRSNRCLINLYNDIFGSNPKSLFGDVFYNGGKKIPHSNLLNKAKLPEEENSQDILKEAKIHLYNGPCNKSIPEILESIKNGGTTLHVIDTHTNRWRKAELGDCCILMQSKGINQAKWKDLRKELIEKKINYVMIAEKGLFQRAEVSLLIDVLDWFSNPHNKDSLLRILRSPIVGLSDRTLRYLAYKNFDLTRVLTERWPDWIEEREKYLLLDLIKLRDDLRWAREGRKTKVLEEIIRYSHLDLILLNIQEGNQCLANIWTLIDIVASWEQEELLSYAQLIDRLKYYREYGEEAYYMAVLADEYDKDSVKVATVHATKGLEFPIVFIYNPQLDIRFQWENFHKNEKLFVKKQGKVIVIKQIPFSAENKEWEECFFTLSNLEDSCSTIDPKFYDHFNREFFSEKWRLYYVALTRARDHLFHSCVALSAGGKRNYLNYRYCWSNIFLKWLVDNKKNTCIDLFQVKKLEAKKDKDELLSINQKNYAFIQEQESLFIPRIINPSHFYDLIYCPRRYQYVVLQQISGGESCSYLNTKSENVVRFGSDLHRALELRNFHDKKPNREYIDFLCTLSKSDVEEAGNINHAVEAFMESDLFRIHELDKKRVKKETDILFKIPGINYTMFMKDKIDLLIQVGNKIKIIDYKTGNPFGKNLGSLYVKEHYKYQLISYKWAVEKVLGIPVEDAILLYYSKQKNQWSMDKVDVDITELENELLEGMKIKITKGGLQKKPFDVFCKDFCEFKKLCYLEN